MGRGSIQQSGSALLYGPLTRCRSTMVDLILPKYAWSQPVSGAMLSDLRSISQNQRYNWLDILGDLEHHRLVGWETYIRQAGGLSRRPRPRKVTSDDLVDVDIFVAASDLDPETRRKVYTGPTEGCVIDPLGMGIYVESIVRAGSLALERA